MSEDEIVASEGTVASLHGDSVGIGNIWERTYAMPGGTERRGPTSMLSFPDDTTLIVGRGSEFDLASGRWHVVDVSEGGSARGWVTFAHVAG